MEEIIRDFSGTKQNITVKTLIMLLTLLTIIYQSCSIQDNQIYFLRNVSWASMTWQDSENLLIYCSFESYRLETLEGGGARKSFFEKGGEIWQINAFTGESSRIILMEDSLYYCENEEIARIILYNGDLYFSGDSVTYKMRNDSTGFDSILPAIMPVFYGEDSCIAYSSKKGFVGKYKIDIGSGLLVCGADSVYCLEYDETREMLLVNNILRYIKDNTRVSYLPEDNLISGRFIIDHQYLVNGKLNDILSIDAMLVEDIVDSVFREGKLLINLDSLDDIQFKENILGIESPNGLYYAMPGCITDTLGFVVATFSIDNDE